ncbi:MAG TPA: DNA polymerase I, partial [Clostridia bacterium]
MTLATSDGFPTNAILGFLNIMQKYISEDKPQYICVAFDLRAKTFRHKQYSLYKANRKGMPDELAVQLPVMKEVLDAMNIKRVEVEGFEADDIIGTLSLEAEKKGIDVVIVTGDRDSLQLASDTTKIKLIATRGGRTESEEFDSARFYDKNHVTPEQYIDVKGLMGDSSDNIPGVKGIGEKTAFDLIIKFGSIQSLYENIQNVDKKSVAEKLKSGMEDALLSRSLALIERSIPGDWDIDAFKNADIDRDKLFNIFKRLEFKSLIEKFGLTGSEESSLNERTSKGYRIIDDNDELSELVSSVKEKRECSILYLADRKDSFKASLAGAAFTWDEGNTAYVPIGRNIGEDTFVNSLKCIFEDPGIKKYGHDLKNFIVYLQDKGVGFNGLYGDTMIAAYVLNPSNNTYTVSELSHRYLDCSIRPIEELSGKGKSYVPFSQIPIDTLSPVAAMHSEAIFELNTVLNNKIKENDQEKLYNEIELPLVEVLASMEYLGFKVNPYELKAYGDELEKRISCLVEEIYEYAGEKFNINSTRQLGVILFEKLNLPIIKKTKTGYSTDAEVLEELESRHDIVKKILEYRHLVKLKSTYADGLMSVISPYTGRVHSSFNQTVTATGRISSTEPNLQNIPVRLPMGREIRKVFIPQNDDFILIDADYSQIELRVLAHIT